ncbi:MAG: dienelactone hydrolase family protein [Polyangiales bacterium]
MGRISPPRDDAKLSGIKAALLGNFAGQDKGIPPADVDTFTAALNAKGKDVDVKVYVPEGHAFMNPNNKGGYHADAATDAWSRIDAFSHAHSAADPVLRFRGNVGRRQPQTRSTSAVATASS